MSVCSKGRSRTLAWRTYGLWGLHAQTYEHESVFLALKTDPTQARSAILSGKMRFKGQMNKLQVLRDVLSFDQSTGGADKENEGRPSGGLRIVSKNEWEPNSSSPCCKLCKARFSVALRRHHCRSELTLATIHTERCLMLASVDRFCGTLACKDCSRHRLDGLRACTVCYTSAKKQQRRRLIEAAPAPASTATQGDAAVQKRLAFLENKLRSLERERSETKALAMLRRADMLSRLIFTGTLLAGAALGRKLGQWALTKGLDATVRDHFIPHVEQQLGRALPAFTSDHLCLLAPILGLLLAWVTVGSIRSRRSLQAFSVASVLLCGFQLTKRRARRAVKARADAIWDEDNGCYAAYLRLAFFQLKSM
jgi:hypothetical protein